MPENPSEPSPAAPLPDALSPEGREFLERPPNLVLRAGSLVLAGMMAMLVVLGVVIEYPDTIRARITISGEQPPSQLVARASGHLESLRVKEGQRVKRGDILAIIQSPARAETVFHLSTKLERLAQALASDAPDEGPPFVVKKDLGGLQDEYAEFLQAYTQWRDPAKDEHMVKTRAILKEQAEALTSQIESLRRQSNFASQESTISRDQYKRLEILMQRNALSMAELQDQQIAILQQARTETDAQRTLAEAEVEAVRLRKEAQDLEYERTEWHRNSRENMAALIGKLRGQIALWEADHVLRAPANGTVAFYDFWTDHQYVTVGQQVFVIVPEADTLVGRMTVAQTGIGKLAPGQRVIVRLDDYPYKEFGAVTGQVNAISLAKRAGANLVRVDLPIPLTTTFQREVPFRQEMMGDASIVTEDVRLIGRVFREIRRAFVR